MAPRAKPGAGKTPLAVVPTAVAQAEREAMFRRERADRAEAFQVHMARLRPLRAATDKAKAAVKVPQKSENVARNACENDGFPLHIVDEILKREALRDPRKTVADDEEIRALMYEAAGLPTARGADQLVLDLRLPDPARDAMDARQEGYAFGLRGDDPDMPHWIHPTLAPEFMAGFGDGQASLGATLRKTATSPPADDAGGGDAPDGPAYPDGVDDDDEGDEVREGEDHPDQVDGEPESFADEAPSTASSGGQVH